MYDPKVIELAAVFAGLLSFCPKFAVVIEIMPAATVGVRNIIIAALILVLSIGINYSESGSVGFI